MSTAESPLRRLPSRLLAGSPDQLKLRWQSSAIIVLYGASLLLVNLGGNRVLTYHEVVFCEPAREMLATGDWLIPRIGGVPFLDKPPLTAWLIAGAMSLFGQSELAVRLPGVVTACFTAWMIGALAARWFGNRVGLIAGLMQTSMYYVLQLARLAECDTHLFTAVCGAMCSFAVANVDSPQGRSTARWPAWAFYLATGLAFMIKGPLGPVFILSACLLFLLVNQDLRGLRFFFNPIGLLILIACVAPYPLLAYAKHPPIWDAFLTHNFGRFRGELRGHKPLLYYFYQVPLVLLPWFPFAVYAVFRGLRQGWFVEPLWRFLVCWLTPGMLVLSASSFKSKHYTAPLMPALTIAAALGLLDYLHGRYRKQKLYHGWWAAAIVGGCSLGAAAVLRFRPDGTAAICGLIGLLCTGLLTMVVLERRRWLSAHLAAAFATCWLMVAGTFAFVMPHHDTYRDQTVLAGRINQVLASGETLYMVQLPDNQISYYLETPLTRIDEPVAFTRTLPLDKPGRFYVLGPEHLTGVLAAVGEVRVVDRCDSLIGWMRPEQRLTLMELTSVPEKTAAWVQATRR